jgi:hypothetical protein
VPTFIITNSKNQDTLLVEGKSLIEARYAYLISTHPTRSVRVTSDPRLIRFSDGETQHINPQKQG